MSSPCSSARATAVLNRFRYGLYPSVDPEIAEWINSFRFGDLGEKRLVLDQLRQRGKIEQLVRLITAEPDRDTRAKLSQSIIANIQKYAYGDREGEILLKGYQILEPLGVPLVLGLPFGHGRPNLPWPVGVRAALDGERAELTVLEAGVSRG